MIERFRIKWILKNRVPVPCRNLLEWGRWMEKRENRIVVQTHLDEEVWVSTVFLGLDHNWSSDPDSLPVLFETMVFGEEKVSHAFGPRFVFRESLDQYRYCTWQEAEEGHARACEAIRRRLEQAREIGMSWRKNEKTKPDENG